MFSIDFFDKNDKLVATHKLQSDNGFLILADARNYAFIIQENYPEIFKWKIYNCIPIKH